MPSAASEHYYHTNTVKIAREGFMPAMAAVIQWRRLGKSVPAVNQRLWRQFVLQLACAGHEEGLYQLGTWYRDGKHGCARDLRKAMRLFELAAARGNPYAYMDLILIAAAGAPGLFPPDFNRAKALAVEAFEHDMLGALVRREPEQRKVGLSTCLEFEHPAKIPLRCLSQNHLGFAYEHGLNDVPQDMQKAFEMYQLDAQRNGGKAWENVGIFYSSGRAHGGRTNQVEANRCWQRGADEGSAACKYHLAISYLQGRGGLRKNRRRALELLYEATEDDGEFDERAAQLLAALETPGAAVMFESNGGNYAISMPRLH